MMWVISQCSHDRRKDATTAVAYIVLHSKRHWLIETLPCLTDIKLQVKVAGFTLSLKTSDNISNNVVGGP